MNNNVEYFPTFKGWLRLVISPRKRVRHSLGKGTNRRRATYNVVSSEPGQNFALDGALKPGLDSKYSINGFDFAVDNDTWIFGDISYGVRAVVEGTINEEGVRCATKVVIAK